MLGNNKKSQMINETQITIRLLYKNLTYISITALTKGFNSYTFKSYLNYLTKTQKIILNFLHSTSGINLSLKIIRNLITQVMKLK